MAKIGFTKLGLKQNNEIALIDFNGQAIEVKQYIPVEEKLEMIAFIMERAHDQNNFSNPIKLEVFTALEIVERYTNINFTEKQKENPTKIYDLLVGNSVLPLIIEAIPVAEYESLIKGLKDTVTAFYNYQTSVLGILDNVGKDYSTLDLDASVIQQKLGDLENIELLQDVMNKLG